MWGGSPFARVEPVEVRSGEAVSQGRVCTPAYLVVRQSQTTSRSSLFCAVVHCYVGAHNLSFPKRVVKSRTRHSRSHAQGWPHKCKLIGGARCVVEQGIRAVVCCLREVEYPDKDFNKDLEYYRVDVEDISREPIELYWPEATQFIHSWVSREQPVLVHCRAGVSRSSSVVMSYLMTYQGYSLHDAFFLVRSRRSCVSPNIGFMEKLCDYEEAQQDTETTVDINKYIAWYTSEGRQGIPDLNPE
ncbi:unnamed protein product [Prorocentrum cordatum]|uniref:Protein-tyrosine-phosphatase n=1 Tax=Prorocentrum cordatum TaxID=2364126 RepID=A0ABN9UZR6_9DINO|nr:unnamed protein product [Polarella glacialis]